MRPHKITVLLLTLVALTKPAFVFAQQQPEKPLPRTLAAAVTLLLSEMSDEDKKLVRNTKEEDLIQFHLGWGMGIRNGLGLWGGNDDLVRSACGGELCHPDDASMKIIHAVWAELQKQR